MILVTGATGNVGSELVSALAARGEAVRALARDPDRATFPPAVQVVAGDLGAPGSLTAALAGRRVPSSSGPRRTTISLLGHDGISSRSTGRVCCAPRSS